MLIANKPISSITESDLLDLIVNQVAEGKMLDYKLTLPGNSDDDKKEFLADLSSFANTAGGNLIFGIVENQGIASNLIGISELDSDKEKLRLENIIRDGIAPRIAGISIQPVQLQNKNSALVIYIPKSWSAPHMVTFKRTSRFYARNSAGKYQLDVHEIRQAFLLSENITEKIKSFRVERISQINSGNTPVPVGNDAKLMLHSIPISSFQSGQLIDIPATGATYYSFFAEQRFTSRYNLDGILLFYDRGAEPIPTEYLQVFRQSQIEYVNGYILGSSLFDTSRTNKISMREVETEIIKIAKSILDYQKSMGAEPPIIISMSLLQVKGFVFDTMPGLRVESAYHNRGIDRDDLLLPDILVDEYPESLDKMSKELKPIFDAVWNAAGWPRSMSFDENGDWKPRRRG